MKTHSFLTALAAWLALSLTSCHAADALAAYGAKVKFSKDSPVRFADFSMTYTGTSSRPSPAPGVSMTSYQFDVVAGEAKIKIAWSAGMGDIGPTRFFAAGKQWQLELKISDTLGRLKDNEMVVSAVK